MSMDTQPSTHDDFPPLTPIEAAALAAAQPDDLAPAQSASQPGPWHYAHLLCALFIAFGFQCLLLPCLCAIGDAKIGYALWFDGLILLRILIAALLRERNNGWKFYLGLIYLSPLWIDALVEMYFAYCR